MIAKVDQEDNPAPKEIHSLILTLTEDDHVPIHCPQLISH